MSAALVIFAIFGWALVLTRGAGPWGILTRLRALSGVFSCPMCAGWWLGAGAGIVVYLSSGRPLFSLAGAASVLCIAGAGAGSSWLGVQLGEVLRRGAE